MPRAALRDCAVDVRLPNVLLFAGETARPVPALRNESSVVIEKPPAWFWFTPVSISARSADGLDVVKLAPESDEADVDDGEVESVVAETRGLAAGEALTAGEMAAAFTDVVTALVGETAVVVAEATVEVSAAAEAWTEVVLEFLVVEALVVEAMTAVIEADSALVPTDVVSVAAYLYVPALRTPVV